MEIKTEIQSTDENIQGARALQAKFHDDPHRPRYHFMPPWSWMNDINGAIWWKGRYHVFYQHHPWGGISGGARWGHASSLDLLHWVHHPIAFAPSEDGYDRNGCWSGGAFVSNEGIPAVIYHGEPGGACIATSADDMLERWTKHRANPVVPMSEVFGKGEGRNSALDPCAWVDAGICYALIGNYVPGVEADGTTLFRSQDLVHWEKVGSFYRSHRRWIEAEEDCAVPDFFPLGDKHMLLFASHVLGSQYYLGRLEGDEFEPEVHGRMCAPGGQLGGPRTLLDDKARRIYFDWIPEGLGADGQRAAGWSGVMTLPRVLTLTDDGALGIEPVPELEALRMPRLVHWELRLPADSETAVEEVRGSRLELEVEMSPEGGREFGVKVRSSPDGAEQTAVLYDATARKLRVNVSRSTLDKAIRYERYRQPEALEMIPGEERTVEIQELPLELAAGESLVLRVFLDGSVLEAFANGRQCITQRIYPTRPDSLGVRLFSRGGGVHVSSFQAWDMAPTHV